MSLLQQPSLPLSGAGTQAALQVQHLSIGFPRPEGMSPAILDVSFDLQQGEILGLVGESGCGKSLTSLACLNLVPSPGQITGGSVHLLNPAKASENLLLLSGNELRKRRGARIAYIPQDPMTSLNPVYTIGEQITEVLLAHQPLSAKEAKVKAIEALESVRIPSAANRFDQYPHEFSGGMRQRVMIAMALCCSPSVLIADEPTTALDVTVQAQILELLLTLRAERGMSILLITHDLGVVAQVCDRVAVMYAGRLVETATTNDLFANPQHPYTQGLLHSIPTLAHTGTLEAIEGAPPAVGEIPLNACAFAPRCPKVVDLCTQGVPVLEAKTTPNHRTRCVVA
ncbi:MAG: ABC transporter ATP-binding protein [Vampirovibrionales bacterium]|nr:ABC transporter ATP-binding protein [Vampirovibrionales bacterium]